MRRAALALAREVERRMPGRATSRWWKEEREGVFIDYNQNARDRTVASAYSVRAVPDARVSCPLEWEEVADVEPAELTLKTVPARLRERGDPSAKIDEHPGRLEALLELAARDEREGLGDAPWPPHFRKQKGEPKRVQPSRARRIERRRVSLPLAAPLKPQLALSRKELPVGEDYCYEVKLDGFRCIAFVDGEDTFLQSRNGKPLGRYFPELVFPAGRYVLDGEIVVRDADGREDFDALGQRIHPAASRIELLAAETPAVYVAFDLLALRTTRCWSFRSPSAALRWSSCSTARPAGVESFDGAPVELMSTADTAEGAHEWLAARGGRDRQGTLRALPAGRAQGHGQGQARAHDRRGARRLAPGQGAGHRRCADPRPLRRPGAARRRALLRAERRREASAGGLSGPIRDGRARLRRPQPLERGQGPRVGRAASRAGRGDRLRPRLRRAHPPRREAAPLARRQAAAGVHIRAAVGVSASISGCHISL